MIDYCGGKGKWEKLIADYVDYAEGAAGKEISRIKMQKYKGKRRTQDAGRRTQDRGRKTGGKELTSKMYRVTRKFSLISSHLGLKIGRKLTPTCKDFHQAARFRIYY
jgi:hypothetical protein